MICRIYHKIGEKKNAIMVQAGQSYPTLKTLTSAANVVLPPFPETQSQNPMQMQHSHQHCLDKHKSIAFHHQESDLKSILNHNHHHPLLSQTNLLGLSPINGVLSSSFSAAPAKATASKPNTDKYNMLDCNNTILLPTSSSILFKSLVSNAIAATATASHCKTEAAISPCLLSDPNATPCCPPRAKYQNNPFFYGMGMDASAVALEGMPSAATTGGGMDTFDDMSTSSEAFTRTCSQMVDPPIQLTADSWPMDL